MVPPLSRRRLLQATGVALTAGLAGCELRYQPKTETTEPTQSGDRERNTPSYQEVGPNADDNETGGNGTGRDGSGSSADGDATPTATPTKTVTPGRTFSFEVENSVTTETLQRVHLPTDTAAQITIIVEENWDDGTEKTVFEQKLALPPGGTRSIPDAFTTKRHGPGYIVRTKLGEFPGDRDVRSRNRSDAHRFTPGGFGGPTGTTFGIWVGDFREDRRLQPVIRLDVPEE